MIYWLLDHNVFPDWLIRWNIRRRLAGVLAGQAALAQGDEPGALRRFADTLRRSPVAVHTDAANEQHYEVPARFFETVLGPRLKYSACLYERPDSTLAEAEQAMLALYCGRGEMRDGLSVLELGCGWGSLSLYLAGKYPSSRITAVSNSRTQKEFIDSRARERGFANLTVVTADMRDFAAAARHDRIFSIEMFEHMRNYEVLFGRVASWLEEDGRFFLHIFTHARYAYLYEDKDPDDWMSRYFFTGGMMPADALPGLFDNDLAVEKHWTVNGTHYQRTLEDWLKLMDGARSEIMPVLCQTYGAGEGLKWWVRWRVFFMACAELFGYGGGNEWQVSHYLLRRAK